MAPQTQARADIGTRFSSTAPEAEAKEEAEQKAAEEAEKEDKIRCCCCWLDRHFNELSWIYSFAPGGLGDTKRR